ncbi:MAG TPA: adenylyltransferase/cytidyltransferase family protein [Candidatus Absconditabacterales bacterium]|nr:adenylyltransferase/cytidyltransferase family protein [Candidatus Absconditabacterales bacterium]
MKTVMSFGAFDVVHEGHRYYLSEAKKYGNQLITIVARDEIIKKVKGRLPSKKENIRLEDVKKTGISDIVILGHKKDMMYFVKKYKPDIIALGYDQTSFVHELSEFLYEKKIKTEVVTIDGYESKKYKSSKIKAENNKKH